MKTTLLMFLLLAIPALADPAAVSLSGAVVTPKNVSLADLATMPSETATVSQQTDHGPVGGTYTGVTLWTLISSAQWKNGPEKNAYLRHTIFVTAGSDGYTASFSEGEIDPKLGGSHAMLTYKKDGAMLTAPQLVAPGDAHAARAVKGVTAVVVQ
ncbi:MAG TPA: hypothetical protein VGF56_13885 [Rhizomicrobium sp.]|jgi:hypothetical protein